MGELDATELPLSADELDTYRIIASGGDPGDRPVNRLVSLGLVSPDAYHVGRWVAHDPRGVAERLMSQAQEDLSHTVTAMAHIPDLAALHIHFDPHRWYGGPSGEFLGSPAEMNARIGEIVQAATDEICTAQPGAPGDRDPEILRLGVERTVAALDRGAGVLTLYSSLAHGHEQTRLSVEAIAAAGGQARVNAVSFQRMIIVDRSHLFIDNLIVDGAEAHAGWHISDRAVVAWARDSFRMVWDRSTRWQDLSRTDSGLTERQEAILRELETGDSQPQVGARLGLSERTVAKELAGVKAVLGARSIAQVMAWWGRSQERDTRSV
ncbi:LuxR C-terminal-related transcriptional regulator [Streptomyces sp. NPDC088182]|uniref:LuxR C-terminal-related transcriptional regulator n=1 Tax=Streptomyces sp. NPDC088182 TaxID=3365838 RepID=UPI0037FF6D85